jgi:putative transposase
MVSVLRESLDKFEPRLLSYCILPKHWHLVVTPRKDGDLSRLVAWLTITHAARWHSKPRRANTGGIYVRRFKSFPVQDDLALLDVLQFVESHPKRVGLVERSQDWRWSSAAARLQSGNPADAIPIASPPIPVPSDWVDCIDRAIAPEILESLKTCILRSRPYGETAWVERTAKRLGIETTLRPRGRPRKTETESPGK